MPCVPMFKKSKWRTKIHTPTIKLEFYKININIDAYKVFGFNLGQSYLATPQSCTKMLRNLAFVALFAIFLHFASDKIKEESATRIFVCLEHIFKNFLQEKQLLAFWEQLLSNVLSYCGQLIGKSSNWWKALLLWV